jgi:DnaJ-class molecular chaperone
MRRFQGGLDRKRKTMEQKDYYSILGLENNATQKEIRDAYRRLALLHHPDRNRDNPEAADRMKEINESYAVLSEPRKRSEYDALRQTYGSSAYGHFRQTHSDQDIFRGSDIQQIFEEFSRAFGFRGFDDIFRESYGAGYRTFEFRKPGVFGRVIVGGVGNRQGAGGIAYPGGYLEKLIRYGLKKKWGIELPERGKDLQDSIVLSHEQARLGGRVRYSSQRTGREFVVTIPANMRTGQQLRLKRMGEAGRAGGEAGDLYLNIRIRNLLIQKVKDFIATLWSFMKPG